MIRYDKGTVFNSGCKWIVNTVNCMGVMGAGIALEFKLRYPEMFNDYKRKCENNEINTGKMSYYVDERKNLHIINFPTKYHFKYPSELSWIEEGLKDFVRTYKSMGIDSVAFSKLGCGRGGLDWEVVKKLMEKYLSNLDIDVVISLAEDKNSYGKELDMVNKFNNMSINELSDIVRLTKAQKDTLEDIKPIKHFYEIEKAKGIGSTTYAKLFTYLYNEEDISEQLSML